MSKRIKKINQLDTLRAFAAFAVIFYHLLPDCNLGKFSSGWMGVDVFFVISGFLITAILLEQKVAVSNKLLIIKNFVIKRTLRLFPVYYLFITFFLVLMYGLGLYVWDPGNGIYYYTYTQNILFFKEGMKGIQANHLWTLAVEEQFYLLWPWLVIYISNKNLIRSLIIVIPLTVFLKSFADTAIPNLRMLTIAHFDTLGGGALLALLLKEKGEEYLLVANKFKMLTILASLITLYIASLYKIPTFFIVVSIFVLSMSLVIGSYYNFTGGIGKILNLPLLQYLGKISYGLYLYHKPFGYFAKVFTNKTHIQINSFFLFMITISLTIITAHLSYHILEKRFLKLKDKFDL